MLCEFKIAKKVNVGLENHKGKLESQGFVCGLLLKNQGNIHFCGTLPTHRLFI